MGLLFVQLCLMLRMRGSGVGLLCQGETPSFLYLSVTSQCKFHGQHSYYMLVYWAECVLLLWPSFALPPEVDTNEGKKKKGSRASPCFSLVLETSDVSFPISTIPGSKIQGC